MNTTLAGQGEQDHNAVKRRVMMGVDLTGALRHPSDGN
jgi:hypothetical protein